MIMLFTYTEAKEEYGSDYQLQRAVAHGDLFKLASGLYSSSKNVSPYAAVAKKYPEAIVTMDSAFFIHGLTDVIPDRINLVTKRNALRIKDEAIKQHFIEKHLLLPGKSTMSYDGADINIYNLERLLVELMRSSSRMPLDYYKEIVVSFRRRVEDMNIRAIEDYINLFERKDFLFDIFQREVL